MYRGCVDAVDAVVRVVWPAQVIPVWGHAFFLLGLLSGGHVAEAAHKTAEATNEAGDGGVKVGGGGGAGVDGCRGT